MKKSAHRIIVILCVILSFSGAFLLIFSQFKLDNMQNAVLPVKPEETPNAPYVFGDTLSALKVEGSLIKNDLNDNIIFKGVMIPDPSVLDAENRLNKDLFERIRNTSANIVRIPVHPELWIIDENYMDKYLVPAVTWANASGMYAVIDFHYIGNMINGGIKGTPPPLLSPLELADEFWPEIAERFKDNPGVIFELCNEPADIAAEEWRQCAEELTASVRGLGATQLIIIGGIQFAQDLSWVMNTPITDVNVAYASHIYPAHGKENWSDWFGAVSQTKPVIITEWGFIDEKRYETEQAYLIGDKETYGIPFLEYLSENNIGWIACWYDDTWEPEMLTAGEQGYTDYRKFVIGQLKAGIP